MIIPSIDLMDGKAVQLQQGKTKILERDDVFALAKQFNLFGEIAVIDLDAALGRGNNEEIIQKLCTIADCRVGGGIRTVEKAERVLSWGAKKIIIGTQATPEFLSNFSPDRIIAAVDSKNGKVVTNGWTVSSGKSPQASIQELEPYCSEFLYTNVNKEGMMQGIDLDGITQIQNATVNKITYAGGITTIGDIVKLENLGLNSQIGMAVYTGEIKLEDAIVQALDFKKSRGLIPTIVQDIYGQVLMLAYSTPDSLIQAVQEQKGVYYSRSRDSIWEKGLTSGNIQQLLKVRYDCDRDTLLFTVAQHGNACHFDQYSCFEDKKFDTNRLFAVLKGRIQAYPSDSYTAKLLQDEAKIKEKLAEEMDEVINYTSRENLIWELADLTYFMQVLMAHHNITPRDIENELWRRRK